MSFTADLRSVSESAIEQLAVRFPDLPRPLLAAIGAGDLTVQRLAELSKSLHRGAGEPAADDDAVDGIDNPSAQADLAGRAKKVAADVAESLEHLADEAPAKVQHLLGELPGKISELSGSLNRDAMVQNVQAYTDLVGNIYATLAERGGKSWAHARSGLKPGTVVDEAPAKPEPEPKAAEVKPEAKPEPKAAEVKPEAKPAEVKPEPKPAEVTPEAKAETKAAEVKPEAKVEPKAAEVKPEPKAEPKPAEVKPEPKVEPKPEPKPGAASGK